VEGIDEESFYPMVDELTRRIKTNFKLSAEEIASDIDKEVGTITTSSPEALKYYIEGRKYYHVIDYRKSIQLYERAIDTDPGFAMAYRSMAMVYDVLGYMSEKKRCLQKALELSSRVSDRERYQIEADYYRFSEKTYDKAIEAYNKLLELYPDDMIGNTNLGIFFNDIEEWDKAIERFNVLIKSKDETFYPYVHIANSYMGKGLFDKAREILDYYLSNFADNTWIHWFLAGNYTLQGEYDLALTETEKALFLSPTLVENIIGKGDIFQYKGELTKAEKEYQKLIQVKEPRAHYQGWRMLATLYLLQGKFKKAIEQIIQCIAWADKFGEMESKAWSHGYLAWLYLATGDYEQALRELDESMNTANASNLTWYQRFNYYERGLVYAKTKSLDKAKKAAEEFKERVEMSMSRKEIRYYYDLMGKIELQRRNFSKTIEYINKALSMEPYGPLAKPVLSLESLALAYYNSGDIEKSRKEYEKITSLNMGRLWQGDLYVRSFYMLGKIHEQQGNNAKAIEHYEKFLDLWKDADPGIAEVVEVRKRLGGLR